MKDLYAALHTEAATEAQARYWDELTSIAASYIAAAGQRAESN